MPPLVSLTLLFATGVVVAVRFGLPLPYWLGGATLALFCGLISLGRGARRAALLALVTLAFFAGALRVSLALLPDKELMPLVGSHVVLEGVVSRLPEESETGTTYVLAVRMAGRAGELRPARGLVLVRDLRPGPRPRYVYGDVLRVQGVLARPQPAGNFGQFDYRAYLERRGIAYLLSVYEEKALAKVAERSGNPLIAGLLSWRERFVAAADVLPQQEAAVLRGIALGERSSLPEKVEELFTASGTVHLLAVSGVHVGLVAGMALGLTRLLRLPLWLQGTLTAALVGVYTLWTGLTPSAVRAAVMFLLGLLGLATGRPKNSLVALAAAALVLLVANPLALFDTGFQLSFAAVGGILLLTPTLLSGKGRLPARLIAPVTVSLAAQLAVWPLTAYYFSGVSLVGFLASLVTVPLAGLALALGLAGLALGVAYLPLGRAVLGAAGLTLWVLTAVARLFASFPWAFLYLKQPPPVFLLVYYLFLLALPWALRRRPCWSRARQGALAAAAILLLAVTWRGSGLGPPPLTVDFLAVGQGDAILIRSPSGQAALIDAGPRVSYGGRVWDAGEHIVLPYLRAQGVHRLEVLFLTHGDMDHAGGAPAILAGLPVGAVVAPPGFDREGPPLVLSYLREKGLPLYAGTCGLKVDLGAGVELTLYWPPTTPLVSESPENDNSLVIYLKYGASTFLFMGDAGVAAEEAMLRGGGAPSATILKVSHHGSSGGTSEAFLQQVRPQLAVISVGKNNFGHPSPETLVRLWASGAMVLRTDEVGQVRIVTDGAKLRVLTRAAEVTP